MENNPFLKAADKLLLYKNSIQKEKESSVLGSILDFNNIVSDFNFESNDESLADNNNANIDINTKNYLSTKYRERINLKNMKNLEKKNLMYNPKYRSHFILNEIINHEEDEETEYKEYFPFQQKEEKKNIFDLNELNNSFNYNKRENHKKHYERNIDHFDKEFIIKKTVCSFLNRKGGRIYFGISDSKKIIGVHIPHYEKDQAQLGLFNMISIFWPSANIKNIRVLFYPIKNSKNKFIRDLYIVKMIVKKGDPFKLYSIQKDSFKSFIRSNNQCINLTAENIMNEIIERNEKKNIKLKSIKNDSDLHNLDLSTDDSTCKILIN